MNQRIILLRSLTKKMEKLSDLQGIQLGKSGWISSIRHALGMTARQLAKRLGVSQPRVNKMELNERNLKISTMEKIAESLGCDFVYGFVPKVPLQEMVTTQAQKKAAEILNKVNASMALEDQLAKDPDILVDLAEEMVMKNIKQIWDE